MEIDHFLNDASYQTSYQKRQVTLLGQISQSMLLDDEQAETKACQQNYFYNLEFLRNAERSTAISNRSAPEPTIAFDALREDGLQWMDSPCPEA